MDHTYLFKQTVDKPLFPDLVWSQPENKLHAGKLLIVGGNLHGFAAPAEAYQVATQIGVGIARVLLPDALKKTVGRVLEAGEYAPSTPSGSFNQKSLDEFLAQAAWADGVLIAGDLGRNSEMAILLEKFATKYSGQLTLTKDTIDYITSNPIPLQNREGTTLILSLSQLQRLIITLKYPQPISFDMPLLRLVDLLHDLTQTYAFNITVKHLDIMYVAVDGKISTTKQESDTDIWRVATAAKSAVWWLQNPTKSFEALTTAISA